jgi:hypothetical protein
VTPYRRHLVGLPLQRSLFSGIDRAPEAICLTGVLADDRFKAWLDEDGDLFLDRSDLELLVAALPERLTPAFLADMQRSLAAACSAVLAAAERARTQAPRADEVRARALLGDLGAQLAALIPFGILSKFVPDVLYGALASTGDDAGPPVPLESPGATLTKAVAALHIEFGACGFSPERLLAEWPDVPPGVADVAQVFCGTHVGFGPLPWEAPGYEEPRYVFGVLQATFADHDPADVLQRLTQPTPPPAADPRSDVAALRSTLAAWLEFLEHETWYVRRAFYVGLVPLLRRLVPAYQRGGSGRAPEDLLFLELHELTTADDVPNAPARRARYLAQTDYLSKHGVTAHHLTQILEAA